jgi:hypothetical protein
MMMHTLHCLPLRQHRLHCHPRHHLRTTTSTVIAILPYCHGLAPMSNSEFGWKHLLPILQV